MGRHRTKPLPSLDLMKRDPVIYPLQRGRIRAFWNENNSTAKANQPTHADPEESTVDQNSISFAAVLKQVKQVLGSYLGIDPGAVIVTNL
jgi:hypothetical protein